MFARHTVAQLDTHPDRCHSCHNLLSNSPSICPNPSSSQNLDGMEEVIRGRQQVATCLAHEDKHCLTLFHFRDCQGHDARRKPHHVELLQLHVPAVIAGGTRSVKFVLKFPGSNNHHLDITCKHCKHKCSQSTHASLISSSRLSWATSTLAGDTWPS